MKIVQGFLVILILITFARIACAGTAYLVCDPQTGVETYAIKDTVGTDAATTISVPATSTGALEYALTTAQDGDHSTSVSPCNMWGCAAETTITYKKQIPSPAGNVKIIVK